MIDFTKDSRGSDNRIQLRKHRKSNKKQELYWIKRAKISWNRFPAPSFTKDVVIVYNESIDDTIEIEPDFYTKDDDLAFDLHDFVFHNDIDQLETLCLYSTPGSIGQLVNNPTFDLNYYCKFSETMYFNCEFLKPMFCNCEFLEPMFCSCEFYEKVCYNCEFNESKTYIGKPVLWIACFINHFNVVRTLIEIGKADVNLPDHENWTPLRIAIFNKHIDIVKYLIEQANAIIDESRDLFVAIQVGSFDIVDYLLNKGCDPNTRLIHQDASYYRIDYTSFALHHAINCYSGDLSIIKTILKHGGDPTLKNDKGQTALHIAIQHKKEKIIKEILYYEFKYDQRDNNNQTPLMLAIVNKETNIINLLYEILPRQQYIDEIMLLACYYTLKNNIDFFHINSEAFVYFEQALRLQEPNSNAIPCDYYLFQNECQTIDELRTIQNNSQLMYIQALLVYERLLPQRHEIHFIIPKLIELSDAYWSTVEYNRSLSILIHVYPMTLSCKENSYIHWDRKCLRKLICLLDVIITEMKIKDMNKMLQAFELIFNQYEDVEQISHLCVCVAFLIETNLINNDDKLRLMRLIQQITHQNYFSFPSKGNILFHQVVLTCLLNSEPLFDRILPENVVRLLIKCGANVNEIELREGYRPLHQVGLGSNIERARSIADILIRAGAHTDCRDYRGRLPEDLAKDIEIREMLHSKRSMSLKCQCTQLIISSGIKYDLYLSKNLKNFILMHQGK